MSNRIDLDKFATKSLGGQRVNRNIIAVIVVVVFTTIFVIFSPRTEVITASLVGEGCTTTDLTGVKCEFVFGEKKLTLRECSSESPCTQSEYRLSKKEKNKQYLIFESQAFTQSVQIIAIDLDNMTQSEVAIAFYTNIKDSCKNLDGYTQDCFDFPVSEDQLKDIYNQNQLYNDLQKEYSL